MTSRHRPMRQLVPGTPYCMVTAEQVMHFNVPMRSLKMRNSALRNHDVAIVDRRRMARQLRREYMSILADIRRLERQIGQR